MDKLAFPLAPHPIDVIDLACKDYDVCYLSKSPHQCDTLFRDEMEVMKDMKELTSAQRKAGFLFFTLKLELSVFFFFLSK